MMKKCLEVVGGRHGYKKYAAYFVGEERWETIFCVCLTFNAHSWAAEGMLCVGAGVAVRTEDWTSIFPWSNLKAVVFPAALVSSSERFVSTSQHGSSPAAEVQVTKESRVILALNQHKYPLLPTPTVCLCTSSQSNTFPGDCNIFLKLYLTAKTFAPWVPCGPLKIYYGEKDLQAVMVTLGDVKKAERT